MCRIICKAVSTAQIVLARQLSISFAGRHERAAAWGPEKWRPAAFEAAQQAAVEVKEKAVRIQLARRANNS